MKRYLLRLILTISIVLLNFNKTQKFAIHSVDDFKLIFYPSKDKILIYVFDSYVGNLFSYSNTKDKLTEKIQKINKGYKKMVENKLLKLLSSLKDDKILDIAAENLIQKIPTN